MKFFLFLLFSIGLNANPDLLIYAQDAGEMFAFLPVIEMMEDVDYLLITGGAASKLAREHSVSYISLDEIISLPISKDWPREKKLSQEDLDKLRDLFQPKLFLTGVGFDLQAQMMDTFSGVSYAYWDNFSQTGENPYFTTAKNVQSHADVLLVPSYEFTIRDEKMLVVGQPSLEDWKSGLMPKYEIAYVGGYGQDYEKAFHLFLSLVENRREQVVILPHPKTDGTFEKNEILGRNNIKVITNQSTKDVVLQSEMVVCHLSSVGMQAQFANKPVIYVIPEQQEYSNPSIERGRALRVSTVEGFSDALQRSNEPVESLYETFHIPENGKELLYKALLKEIGSSE